VASSNTVLVKNLTDTGDDTPKCGCKDWIQHWRVQTGKGEVEKVECSKVDCKQEAEHGAHVRRLGAQGRLVGPVYIVATCPDCNNPNKPGTDKPYKVPEATLVEVGLNSKCSGAQLVREIAKRP